MARTSRWRHLHLSVVEVWGESIAGGRGEGWYRSGREGQAEEGASAGEPGEASEVGVL